MTILKNARTAKVQGHIGFANAVAEIQKLCLKIAYAAGIQNHVENVLARMTLILMNMVYAQRGLVVNLFSIKMITKK